jgi:putative membrane protein
MERQERQRVKISILALAALYSVGVAGLLWPLTQDLFRWLVPLNLLISALILFLNHRDWKKPVLLFFFIVYLASYFIEVAGVHSGKIFGRYSYGDGLGLKMFSTPLIIGLNWLMLVYCTGNLVVRIGIGGPWKALTGAAIMTFVDYLLEPVAVQFNWWSWEGQRIPTLNFIAWFYLSFLFLSYFFRVKGDMKNPVAPWLLLLQAAFFALVNIGTFITR